LSFLIMVIDLRGNGPHKFPHGTDPNGTLIFPFSKLMLYIARVLNRNQTLYIVVYSSEIG